MIARHLIKVEMLSAFDANAVLPFVGFAFHLVCKGAEVQFSAISEYTLFLAVFVSVANFTGGSG